MHSIVGAGLASALIVNNHGTEGNSIPIFDDGKGSKGNSPSTLDSDRDIDWADARPAPTFKLTTHTWILCFNTVLESNHRQSHWVYHQHAGGLCLNVRSRSFLSVFLQFCKIITFFYYYLNFPRNIVGRRRKPLFKGALS